MTINADPKEAGSVLKGCGLTRTFGTGKKTVTAVNHVDFDFHEGEIVSIVGESGSGKTTICNLIARFYDVSLRRERSCTEARPYS